ncbi:Translation machinery-associated protein 22 [Aspergillus fumigatus]|nr:Translation machinery-associated protein 22 [Aspergillus fumigatus]KAH1846008.1 Translation machinery-associated protein 22 [Aspergillus fumigatus]KAH1914687.1 Translation machinery-associated protein 22 [Aspergillus fumigatus]KAH1956226.1 Translation machinery-associated protein 22 [Aspergillus fumigatus]KAH2172461.1 Translation machinery-associated protein 22 [Aspergillus fumigatus]
MSEVAQNSPAEVQAKKVVYCGVCTLPPEYCEFGGTAKKCEEWLKDNHAELYQRLYSEEALCSNLSELSVSVRERAAKDAAKKEAKAAAAEARDAERKAAAKVQIKRVERNKRKHVTVITGLEVHGLENKKVAKELGKKFATGSSVTKSPAGVEEITVQGDVSEDVKEWLLELYGKEIPESNIELVEDKKKKTSG